MRIAIGATDIASETLSMKSSRVLIVVPDDEGIFECGRRLGRMAARKSRSFFSPWTLFESWGRQLWLTHEEIFIYLPLITEEVDLTDIFPDWYLLPVMTVTDTVRGGSGGKAEFSNGILRRSHDLKITSEGVLVSMFSGQIFSRKMGDVIDLSEVATVSKATDWTIKGRTISKEYTSDCWKSVAPSHGGEQHRSRSSRVA